MWYLAILGALTLGAHESTPKGHLVIVGGGAIDRTFCEHVLQVAGGRDCHVVVITLAAGPPNPQSNHYRIWGGIGARNVDLLDPDDPKEALDLIRHADLIWFGGGSQMKLTRSLGGTELLAAIRQRYWDGATIAGTSAGAAVMSDVMIAGNTRRPDIRPVIDKGFGFWPDVIVDQHFVRRKRFDRLKQAVLEHPTLLGVGIDESTGVVVTGRQFEVIGASDVIIIDARPVSSQIKDSSTPEVSTHVLRAGMRYDLDKGIMDVLSKTETVATDG